MVMTGKSYPVQRHIPATVNMEVPPPPPIRMFQRLRDHEKAFKTLELPGPTHKLCATPPPFFFNILNLQCLLNQWPTMLNYSYCHVNYGILHALFRFQRRIFSQWQKKWKARNFTIIYCLQPVINLTIALLWALGLKIFFPIPRPILFKFSLSYFNCNIFKNDKGLGFILM